MEFPEGGRGIVCGPFLENPEGWGGHMKNPFRGGGMDIFWNHTIYNSQILINSHPNANLSLFIANG